MTIQGSRQPATELECRRKYDVTVMHLFDENVVEEKALCGANTSADQRMGVNYYLDMRKDGFSVGTVCEGCKVRALPLAVNLAQYLEAEGLVAEAEEYRQLAQRLLKETGWMTEP